MLCASCVQSTGTSSERQGAGGALVETQDEGDFGSESPIDLGASPPPPSVPLPGSPFGERTPGDAAPEPASGGNLTYYACIFVKNSSETLRRTFCGSLPAVRLRAVCYSHLNDGPTKLQNYCYDTFYNE